MHKTHVCCSGDNLHNFMGDGPMAFLNMDMGHMAKKIMGHVKHCMSNFEGWVPYNIEENENNYLITIPLPGLSKDDVKVSLISNNLNISAKKPSEEIKDKKPEDQKEDINCGGVIFKDLLNYLWNKDVNLDVPLPSDIDREKIISKMNNGLLKIKIEKLPPKNININTGDNLN
ncbi:MAG: Hsp20/alpha crystallin family protein [Candidatus Lokiarchaeota archaeon]|nr:Hsp20/alpha crystallin family protein [Candidatus Lokiarchaeota archaeon]